MHPLQLIFNFFSSIFTWAFIAADIYLFREWYLHKDITYDEEYAKRCLIFALIILLINSFGRFFSGWLLGKKDTDAPDLQRSDEQLELERPEGHKLHIEFYGNANSQPIIMLHGWSSNSLQWYYFKKHLAKNFRLIVVDMPGLGKSGKPKNNDYSLAKFSNDLKAVIDLCENKKPFVLGHSIGGMTILNSCKLFGQSFYQQISGLILLHTTYTNPSKTCKFSSLVTALQKPVLTPILHIMIALAPIFQISNWLKFFNGSMHVSNRITGFAGTETRGQLSLTAYLSTIAPVDVVSRGCLAMFEYDATNVLPEINCPVLIVTGEQDILTEKEASHLMANSIPNAKLVELKPSAHMAVLERNMEIINAVSHFAQDVKVESVFD